MPIKETPLSDFEPYFQLTRSIHSMVNSKRDPREVRKENKANMQTFLRGKRGGCRVV